MSRERTTFGLFKSFILLFSIAYGAHRPLPGLSHVSPYAPSFPIPALAPPPPPPPNTRRPQMVLVGRRAGMCHESCNCHQVEFDESFAECLFTCESSDNCGSAEWEENSEYYGCKHCFEECHISVPALGVFCYRRKNSKTNPCKNKVGSEEGDGPYPNMIARQFISGVVVPTGVKRNLFCKCESTSRMVCTIKIKPNSVEADTIRLRLDRNKPMDLPPFYIEQQSTSSSSQTLAPICFKDQASQVVAEMILDDSGKHVIVHWSKREESDDTPIFVKPIRRRKSKQTISRAYSDSALEGTIHRRIYPAVRRTKSAPLEFHYPTNLIPMYLCTQGGDAVCPITQQSFHIGDIVYVLKSERDNVMERKPVVCFSASGLTNYAACSASHKFQDPIRREESRLLTMAEDYEKYVLADIPNIHEETFPDSSIPDFWNVPAHHQDKDSGSELDDTPWRPVSFPLSHQEGHSQSSSSSNEESDSSDFDDTPWRPVSFPLRNVPRSEQHVATIADSSFHGHRIKALGESLLFFCFVSLSCFCFKNSLALKDADVSLLSNEDI